MSKKRNRQERRSIEKTAIEFQDQDAVDRVSKSQEKKDARQMSGKKHKKTTELPQPRNDAQAEYMRAIQNNSLVFGIGKAGTGKTFICGSFAAHFLEQGIVDQIVVTRPAVESEEELGFLPGKEYEKYEPYLRPIREVLDDQLGGSRVENDLKNEKIRPVPFAYMRGMTFKNAFVILDEAQNATPGQIKMFLTRIGEGSIVVINGDPDQPDIEGPSGLLDAMDRGKNIPEVRTVWFEKRHVVRSDLGQKWVEAYEDG